MAAPTVQGRIESLDVLRGVAILGILIANIWSYGWPTFGASFGPKYPIPHTNDWVEGLRVWLITGKMRGLLCLLFGAGLYLQYQKLSAAGKWPGLYARRTLLLAAIGVLHIVLLWYGDILLMYSLIALGAMLFVRVPPPWLAVTGWSGVFFSTLAGLGMTVADLTGGPSNPGSLYSRFAPPTELLVYQQGSLLEQLQLRVSQAGLIIGSLPLYSFEMGGLFLIGMWMASQGLFRQPSARMSIVRWLAAVGVVGVLLNGAAAWQVATTQKASYETVVEFGLNAPMSVGIAILGACLTENFPRGWFARLIGAPGRMALTTYLMQSLLCCAIFYGWGFGLFGKLDYWGLLAVAAAVLAANIGFAHAWLSRFTMGPVEWVWRWLSYGQRPALIRTVSAP